MASNPTTAYCHPLLYITISYGKATSYHPPRGGLPAGPQSIQHPEAPSDALATQASAAPRGHPGTPGLPEPALEPRGPPIAQSARSNANQ